MLDISAGASGMYDFYCFNGSIYQIVGDEDARILVYDKSEISAEPIGHVHNPIYPDDPNAGVVYNVTGVAKAVGASTPQSIAIELVIPVIPTPEYYYQRADYFASDIAIYNGQSYQIAPVYIVGILTDETEAPYAVDEKLGETADGYDVYSYKNPPFTGALAIDMPGMTCDLGYINLYPIAMPIDPTR